MKNTILGLIILTFSSQSMAWTHHKSESGHYWDADDSRNAKNFLALTCNTDESSNIIFYNDGETYQIPKISAYKSIKLLVGYSGDNEYTLIDEKNDPVKGNPHSYTGKDFARIFSISSSFKIITSDGKKHTFIPGDTNKIDFSVCY